MNFRYMYKVRKSELLEDFRETGEEACARDESSAALLQKRAIKCLPLLKGKTD